MRRVPRPTLSALTGRGKGVLTVGIAAAVFGWTSGVADIVRIGGVLVLLPLVAAVAVRRSRPQVTCLRAVTPRRVAAGHQARVELHVTNTGRLPTAALLAEDLLPTALGRGPRFTFARVEAGGSRGAAYTLPVTARGRYALGPLSLRLRDTFGLAQQVVRVDGVTDLVVTPPVVALEAVPMGGAFTAGASTGRRSLAAHGEDDVGTRPWRDGDDLRRVHWRTTARTGELAVRREEQPWSASATVLLDTRTTAHAGDGRASSFEWAVSAAASVAVHLGERGLPCRLATSGGRVVDPQLSGPAGAAVVVDALATIRAERGDGLAGVAGASLTQGVGGVLVAVCGSLSPDDAGLLLQARGQSQGIAVLLDVASWTTGRPGWGQPVATTADLLALSGWDVVVARRGQTLDALWPRLAAPRRLPA